MKVVEDAKFSLTENTLSIILFKEKVKRGAI
jgi:hypothetical protein